MRAGPIIVMGVCGCGKTTIGKALAARLEFPFIEGDALHPAANVAKMSAGTPLIDEDRWPWLSEIGRQLREASGKDGAVATCSSLKRAYRDKLRQEAGEDLRFVFLDCSRKGLEERMRLRQGHFMPASLLASQLATLESPNGERGVVTVNGDASHDEIIAEALAKLGVEDV